MTIIHLPSSPTDYVINLRIGDKIISLVGVKTVNPTNTDDGFYDVSLDPVFSEAPKPEKRVYQRVDRAVLPSYETCRCSNKSGGFSRDENGLFVHGECHKPTKGYLDAMNFKGVIYNPDLVEA